MKSVARSLPVLGMLGLVSIWGALSASPADANPTAPALCNPAAPLGSADSCASQPPQTWPLAAGSYTSPQDSGWIFFRANGFDGGCGISPDGTVGCDAVPDRGADGTPIQAGQPGPAGSYSCEGQRCPLPPPDANQIVAGPQQPAEYSRSDSPTFTRVVDVLPPGYRLVNGGASCVVGYQGTVSCTTGANGFTLSSLYAVLE